MSDQQDQQLFQIQNILETLLEATDHFSKLVQQRDFPQSVYTFTSITEGAGAVTNSLNELNKDFTEHNGKLASILDKIKNQLKDINLQGNHSILADFLFKEFKNILNNFQAAFHNQIKNK